MNSAGQAGNAYWLAQLAAQREAEAAKRPVEDRVLMFKADGTAQRQRCWQLRAEAGVLEHPEWTDERIAEEYVGASTEFVLEARKRRTHGGTRTPKPQESPTTIPAPDKRQQDRR